MTREPTDPRPLATFLLRRTEPRPPAGGHLDENSLALLEVGGLSTEELARLRSHAAACPPCRRLVGEVLEEAPAAIPLRAAPVGRRRVLRAAALVAAASLLAAMSVPALIRWATPEVRLAMADRALRAGDPAAALNRLRPLLSAASGTEGERARALGHAAYREQMVGDLTRGAFDAVEDAAREADRLGIRSTRLASLRAQAARRIPDPLALLVAGRLDWFGVPLQAPRSKSLDDGEAEPAAREALARLDAALKASPDGEPDRQAYLNLAHAQLSVDPRAAAARFDAWLRSHPGDCEALLGRGLAEYLAGDFAAAAGSFEELLDRDPADRAARVNLALALEEAGHIDAAIHQWRRVAARAADSDLHARVTNRLRLLGAAGVAPASPSGSGK